MSSAQPKPAEPSMEEILASIRRIISDDQTPKAAAPAPQQTFSPAVNPIPVVAPVVQAPVQKPVFQDDDDDIMDLEPKPVTAKKALEPHFINDDPIPSDVSFVETPPPAPVAQTIAMSKQNEFDAILAETEFQPSPPVMPVAAPVIPDRLVSQTTDRVVSTAFSSLASTVLANNARTLENLVEEMMRPMIKNWLDDNLPNIVERLIKAEIERVARGGR